MYSLYPVDTSINQEYACKDTAQHAYRDRGNRAIGDHNPEDPDKVASDMEQPPKITEKVSGGVMSGTISMANSSKLICGKRQFANNSNWSEPYICIIQNDRQLCGPFLEPILTSFYG